VRQCKGSGTGTVSNPAAVPLMQDTLVLQELEDESLCNKPEVLTVF
jgi:hypothetical protein